MTTAILIAAAFWAGVVLGALIVALCVVAADSKGPR